MNSRAYLTAVRTLLPSDWDPIGVRDAPTAQDEYDAYAKGVLGLLEAGASQARLADYLIGVEADAMGLHPDRRRAEAVVARLMAVVSE